MIPLLDDASVIQKLNATQNRFFDEYYAFYSSWYGGITTNPHLMLLPIDDHMVHRGDGVFEAMKSVNKKVYLMDEHIERLFLSAEKIHLQHFFTPEHIKATVLETLQVAGKDNAMIRIFLSRGPGSFSVNPYDAIGAQLYIVVTKPPAVPSEKYEHGVAIGKSHVPTKSSWLSQVKSCNYLPNVLMKKEAVDRKLDFVIGISDNNFITESATENILILDENNKLVYPVLQNILKGTTMVRVCELAKQAGFTIESRDISIDDLLNAQEAMMMGTTLNVLPVVRFEDQPIGKGIPGPTAKLLNELLIGDMPK